MQPEDVNRYATGDSPGLWEGEDEWMNDVDLDMAAHPEKYPPIASDRNQHEEWLDIPPEEEAAYFEGLQNAVVVAEAAGLDASYAASEFAYQWQVERAGDAPEGNGPEGTPVGASEVETDPYDDGDASGLAAIYIAQARMRDLERRRMTHTTQYAELSDLLAFADYYDGDPNDPKAFANPHHDAQGRFARGSGGAGGIAESTPSGGFRSKSEHAVHLHHQGVSHGEIARQLGITQQTVHAAVKLAAAREKARGGTARPVAAPAPRPTAPRGASPAAATPPPVAPPPVDRHRSVTQQIELARSAKELEGIANTLIGSDRGLFPGGKVAFTHSDQRDANQPNIPTALARDITHHLNDLHEAFPAGTRSLSVLSVADRDHVATPIGERTYGRFMSNPISLGAHGNTIQLNPKRFNDAVELNNSLRRDEQSGFHPIVGDSWGDRARSVVTHEFGHNLDAAIEGRLKEVAISARSAGDEATVARAQKLIDEYRKFTHGSFYDQLPMRGGLKAVSDYAKTNRRERVAEAFAAGYHNPTKYPQGKRIVTMFKAAFSEWRTPSGDTYA